MIVQPAKLRNGAGNGKPEDGLCLMQMVDWFAGNEKVTDTPACACPVLTALGIRLNDIAPDQAARDSLWPLVWRLLDSKDVKSERLRSEHIVREVTHRIIALVFDTHWPEHASALRKAHSMLEIEAAARAASACATAKAATAWEAVRAASVAEAAARAASAAKAATTWAARAATATAWDVLKDIFIEAIELGKHSEEDPTYIPRATELHRILADAS